MRKRQFKKHFNREHAQAHQYLDLKDNLLDLAEELQERELLALEYKRDWEHEKQLRETLTTELGKDLNNLVLLSRKKVQQALIAGVATGVAAGIVLSYIVQAAF